MSSTSRRGKYKLVTATKSTLYRLVQDKESGTEEKPFLIGGDKVLVIFFEVFIFHHINKIRKDFFSSNLK